MVGAIATSLVAWASEHFARGTPSARAFSLCPLYLMFVLVVLAVTEAGAAFLDLPAPHQVLSPLALILAGILMSVLFLLIARPTTAWEYVCCVAAGYILPLGNTVMPAALSETEVLLPHVYDANVFAMDGAFGLQPSIALGTVLIRHDAIRYVCMSVYAWVLLPPAVVAMVEGRLGRRAGIGSLPSFLAIAGVGFLIYHILPVIGPRAYLGGTFPVPSVHPEIGEPRNAMPSLHIGWVLMAFLCARGMPVTRFVVGVWLAVMVIATMGLGEHYMTDLICALPFVLVLRALCASDIPWATNARRGSAVVGTLVFCIWGSAVRGVIHPAAIPGLVPLMAVCTAAASIMLERSLARAQGLLPDAD